MHMGPKEQHINDFVLLLLDMTKDNIEIANLTRVNVRANPGFESDLGLLYSAWMARVHSEISHVVLQHFSLERVSSSELQALASEKYMAASAEFKAKYPELAGAVERCFDPPYLSESQ